MTTLSQWLILWGDQLIGPHCSLIIVNFIDHSVNNHSDHPSIKLIKEHPEHHNNFSFKHVHPSKIETNLSKLNTKKATGYDGLAPKLIKAAAPAISTPLSGIVNDVYSQSKFPSQAKAAEVGTIYKKDSQLEKNNYRPVSVLTTLSKVIEIDMNQQLSEFYEIAPSALVSAYRKG